MKIKSVFLCLAALITATTSSPILAQTPRTAAGTAVVVNGFMVAVNLTDGGYGYTNNPSVRFEGDCGAGAFATVSNGSVISITVTNAGAGCFSYTNDGVIHPLVIISPPIPPPSPRLSVVSPALLLTFTNLTILNFPESYQFQIFVSNNWVVVSDLPSRMVDGVLYPIASVVTSDQLYRLIIIAPPSPPVEVPPQSILVTPGLLLNWSNLVSYLPYQLQSSIDFKTWSDTLPFPNIWSYTNVTLFQAATDQIGFFRLKYVP